MIEEGKILFGGETSFIAFQINFIAIILILIVSFLFFLHYGFGALSRMENILKRILQGDYSLRIHLRKRDVMKSFAEKLNAILDLLEEYKTNKRYSEKK
jgi:signal transduction histidine kinase